MTAARLDQILGARPDERRDVPALAGRQLDQPPADRAGRTGHQQAPSLGPEQVERLACRQRAQRDGGGDVEAEPVGYDGERGGLDHEFFGVGTNRGGDVDVQPGDSITHGEPAHVRADLGDGAAEVEPQPDLLGQAEGVLVGGDERVEVGERGGRDGDPYVTCVDVLEGGEFGDDRLIRSAAGNDGLHRGSPWYEC